MPRASCRRSGACASTSRTASRNWSSPAWCGASRATRCSTPPPASTPRSAQGQLLDTFLERRATVGIEDTSPSVQRFREMIGRDEKMLAIFEWIRTAAKSDISVLILGPTGAGKEVVARMIHELSRRGPEKFQAVNCAALPDTLFESEIFGYEKGAFTGAHDRKPGRLELANGGTFFLDEVGDLSLVAQAKILRVLEERRFERLGGSKSIHVDFRLISATNRPLDLFVRESRFREDLFYRVNAFAIRLPSLKERAVDIPVLAARFLGRYCASNGLPLDAKRLSQEATDRLLSYHWPGNIRELESTMSRAALSAPGHIIRAEDIEFLHSPLAAGTTTTSGKLPTLRDAERAHIALVLEAVSWNKLEAARVLDISRGTLYRKIDEYGLEPSAASTPRAGRRVTRRPPVGMRALPSAAQAFIVAVIAAGAAILAWTLPQMRLDTPYLFLALLRALERDLGLQGGAALGQRLDDVGLLHRRLRGAAAARAQPHHDHRGVERLEPVHVPHEADDAALPHALQHGVAGHHRAGGRLGLRAARRRPRRAGRLVHRGGRPGRRGHHLLRLQHGAHLGRHRLVDPAAVRRHLEPELPVERAQLLRGRRGRLRGRLAGAERGHRGSACCWRRRSTSPTAPTRSTSGASTTSGATCRRCPTCTWPPSRRWRWPSTPRTRRRRATSAACRSTPPAWPRRSACPSRKSRA